MKDLINDYVLSTWPHNYNIDGNDGVDDEEEEEEYGGPKKIDLWNAAGAMVHRLNHQWPRNGNTEF